MDTRSDPSNMLPISEGEFQEIMERNKTVSSSAIARAVQDASAGECYFPLHTFFQSILLFVFVR